MRVDKLGREAVRIVSAAGVELDEWQVGDLLAGMAVDSGPQWRNATVCLCMSRQNGKGEVLHAREVHGGTMLGERILHTAQELSTSERAFERAQQVLEALPELMQRVKTFRYGRGEKQIEFVENAGLFYRSRGPKSGRGIDDISLVVYDEAQHLTQEEMAASSPTLAVAEHSQRWLTGSAGMASSEVWHGLRRDGLIAADAGRGEPMTGRIVGQVARFLWVEYTAETVTVHQTETGPEIEILKPDPADRDAWALANPAFPHRITAEFLEDQLRLLGPDKFSREHLGVWDQPSDIRRRGSPISAAGWEAVTDGASQIDTGLVLAVATGWDLVSSAIVAGGRRKDGLRHVEVVQSAGGADWVGSALAGLIDRHRPALVAFDATGPARQLRSTLERVCEERGVKLRRMSGPDYAASCRAFAEAVESGAVRHLGQDVLSNAVLGAEVQRLGDGWVWSWRSGADIAALSAATVADWCAEGVAAKRSAYETGDGLLLV